MIAFDIVASQVFSVWSMKASPSRVLMSVDHSGETLLTDVHSQSLPLKVVAGSVTPLGCILSVAHLKPQSWWKAHIRYHYFVSKKAASYDALCRWLRWSSFRLSEN